MEPGGRASLRHYTPWNLRSSSTAYITPLNQSIKYEFQWTRYLFVNQNFFLQATGTTSKANVYGTSLRYETQLIIRLIEEDPLSTTKRLSYVEQPLVACKQLIRKKYMILYAQKYT